MGVECSLAYLNLLLLMRLFDSGRHRLSTPIYVRQHACYHILDSPMSVHRFIAYFTQSCLVGKLLRDIVGMYETGAW